MRTIFYKDIKQSAVWIAGICIVLIVIVCVAPYYSGRFLFSYFTCMLFIVPSSIAMSDSQEKADKMYSILPVRKTDPVLLRYLYLGAALTVTTLLLQSCLCLSNYVKGYSLFNINNVILQSVLIMSLAFASLWLLSSLTVKNRFLNFMIIMFIAVAFGIVVGCFGIETDFSKMDYVKPMETHRLDLMLRSDLHILFWCVCLLISLLCYAAACAVVRRRNI